MKTKQPTIYDIAKETSLSPSSVSRALHDHPKISYKTKEKVTQVAKAIGYRPNLPARGLVQRKSNLLGLLVNNFLNPFYVLLTRSIQEAVRDYGYWVIHSSTDDDYEKTRWLIDSMMNLRVQGLILATTRLEDPLVEKLIDDNFPVVQAVRRLKKDKGDQVVADYTYGSYLAVSHLIRIGRKRISIIIGPKDLSTTTGVYDGYLKTLTENGLEIDNNIIKRGHSYSQITGYDLTKKMMRLSKRPDAIFCLDDHVALGVMRALGELEIKVPEDVAIVGFDDIELASHPLIQLTTVRLDVDEMGKIASKLIIDRIDGKAENYQKIVMQPKLVIRRSCGA